MMVHDGSYYPGSIWSETPDIVHVMMWGSSDSQAFEFVDVSGTRFWFYKMMSEKLVNFENKNT